MDKNAVPGEAATPATDPAETPAANPSPPRRGPGHRGADMRDTAAEMAERAQIISQEAGSKVAAAMKDVISAAAGIAGFAIESARDLVQYMVKRGQMTPEEADKLIREAEAAHDKRPASEKSRPTATTVAAERAAVAKAEAAARAAALAAAAPPFRPMLRPAAPPSAPASAPKPTEKVVSPPAAQPVRTEKAVATPKPSKTAKPVAKADAKPAAKAPKPTAKKAAKASKNVKVAKPAKKGGKH